MDMDHIFTLVFVSLNLIFRHSICNQYDPHLIPKSGPFFEGWYVRILPCKSNDSFGFLFGNVLPASSPNISNPLVLGSILLKSKCSHGNCVLSSHDAVFKLSDLNITVKDGRPVSFNPDDETPPYFQWRANSGDNYFIFEQRNNQTSFDIKIRDISLTGTLFDPKPWGNHGEGPEGWIDKLPFVPLHWFVYSLNSSVSHYVIKNSQTGEKLDGRCGFVHQEMNWGNSFPKAWVWSQGFSANDQALYAMSGGPVSFGPVTVSAYLIGYRNYAKDIVLNFRPDNGIVTMEHVGCQGYVNVTAYGWSHELHMTISAPMSTFSDCLLGPQVSGFKKSSVESYDAVAKIYVYKREPMSRKLVDFQQITPAALEFGGEFICNKKCSI